MMGKDIRLMESVHNDFIFFSILYYKCIQHSAFLQKKKKDILLSAPANLLGCLKIKPIS